VLERLARARSLVIDKTGTLTHGHAELSSIVVHGGHAENEILRLAASLDQASGHVIAASIAAAARHRMLALTKPTQARETAGEGIVGRVDGRRVIVGGPEFVRKRLGRARLARPDVPPGTVTVAVAIDGKFAGYLFLADSIRPEALDALAAIRRSGIANIVLASGDSRPVVARIAAELGIAEAHGELSPEDKVRIVVAERQRGPVIMAGDGVNDAPALAAADIGIAMGARGSPASSEAADAVLLTDRLDRIGESVAIAKRSLAIARQSVIAGLGLSVAAMAAAALGYLPPVQGALIQEAIDVAVILNALRALR
jgi:P-type E1-E2 ATPase